jgi:hypothetical protein
MGTTNETQWQVFGHSLDDNNNNVFWNYSPCQENHEGVYGIRATSEWSMEEGSVITPNDARGR